MNHNALRDDETYYAPNFFGSSNTLEQAYDSMLFLCKLCAENLDAEKSISTSATRPKIWDCIFMCWSIWSNARSFE